MSKEKVVELLRLLSAQELVEVRDEIIRLAADHAERGQNDVAILTEGK